MDHPVLGQARRLLVLRTAKWDIMGSVLTALAAPAGGQDEREIAVLAQPGSRYHLPEHIDFSVIEIRPGMLSLSRLPLKALIQCRWSRFDAIVVPFSNDTGRGYGNVLSLVPLLGNATAVGIGSDLSLHEVTRRPALGAAGTLANKALAQALRPLGLAALGPIVLGLHLGFAVSRSLSRSRVRGLAARAVAGSLAPALDRRP